MQGFFFYLIMADKKKVIIIAGPTAVGKTAVAIHLALQLGTEIISADSRQCYRELKIGVARPSDEELKMVPHHFIATHSIHQKLTAASFEDYALQKTSELFQDHDTIVMVGGTGLYIKAFCEGLDPIPEVPEEIRNQIIAEYEEKGLEWLQQEVLLADPEFYKVAEVSNPHRLMRALEVIKATGRPILDYRKGHKAQRDFEVIKIALELPREILHAQINKRVDQMMSMGLLDEVRSLFSFRHLNALQTVGYKELFNYLERKTSLDEAVDEIKKNTRQYAKRQMTWFKKDLSYRWFSPDAAYNLGENLLTNLHL